LAAVPSKIAVLGAGAWGTSLARLWAEKFSVDREHSVTLWTWLEEHAQAMRVARENAQFFPGFALPENLVVSSDLALSLAGSTVVVCVIPTFAFRETLTKALPLLPPEASLVSASKGMEENTSLLMTEVLADLGGDALAARASVLSGPSFAKEVAEGIPTTLVLAGDDAERAALLQRELSTERFRVYQSEDPIGVQVGGALKNVIAIAVGACGGLGFGHNTKAALITRGLAELARLAMAKGGSERTLSGLAGLGDLVLTCTGELSRNRTVGFEMGQGRELKDVLKDLGHVAEGVKTAKSAHLLAQKLGVDLPITSEVFQVLYEGKSPADAVRALLARPLRRE
jgi:glycerol-3-phosphate dehydrogenase (NAD(P)+)